MATRPLLAGTTEGFVDGADGVRIHYLAAGPSAAPRSLLLIPGWRVSAVLWADQLEFFAGLGYRVVAIDSRSQGASTVMAERNAPEDRAGDIAEVIARLGLRRLLLVGWSQGVQDVAAYVSRCGTGAVDGFVLVDGTVSAGAAGVAESPAAAQVLLQRLGMYASDPRAYTAGMLHAILSSPRAAAILDRLVEDSMKTPLDVGISMLVQDLLTTDRRPALGRFDKPTLVVATAEASTLEEKRRMASALPRGELVVIPRAAHAVFFDQPAEFDRQVAAFVRRLGEATKTP